MAYGALRISVAAAFVLLAAASLLQTAALAQERPFSNVVITEAPIGDVEPGAYKFKVTMTTVAPNAEIPFHVHKYPGVRYMLEGSLTIHWKGRGSQTYSAGSTYFEAAGANHPETGMSAANPLDVPARLIIIELVPVE